MCLEGYFLDVLCGKWGNRFEPSNQTQGIAPHRTPTTGPKSVVQVHQVLFVCTPSTRKPTDTHEPV
jgi:hypothetical protein